MTQTDLANLLTVLEDAGALRDTLRSGRTALGRPESAAEHSWRLCLIAMALAPAHPGLDAARVLQLCVVHDLGETISGDVPATRQGTDPERKSRERRDFLTLLRPAPAAIRESLIDLYDEYDSAATAEARFVKAIDKLETLITHAQGPDDDGIDFAFNLTYGRQATDRFPMVAALRSLVDVKTRARVRPDIDQG